MFVVDLMHEFEQGVWKNLFTHLVRMLHASAPALVIEMDRRYIFPFTPLPVYTICDGWNVLQVPPGAQIWTRWDQKVLG